MRRDCLLGCLAIAVAIIGGSTRLIYLDSHLRHLPDALEYVISAQELVTNGKYLIPYWSSPMPPRYPPGYPILIALFDLLFGINETSAKYCTVFFGGLSILLIYVIGRHFFGSTVGLLSEIMLVLYPVHRHWSAKAFSDIPSGFFVMAAILCGILCSEKRSDLWAILTGILGGYAVLIRQGNIIIYPILLIIAISTIHERKKILRLGSVCVGISLLTVAPLLLYNYSYFGNFLANSYTEEFGRLYAARVSIFTEFSLSYAFAGSSPYHGNLADYMLYLAGDGPSDPTLGITGLITSGLAFIGAISLRTRRKTLTVLLSWVVIYLAFYSVYFFYIPRLLAPMWPPFLLLSSVGLWSIAIKTDERFLSSLRKKQFVSWSRHLRALIVLIVLILLLLSSLHQLKYTIEDASTYETHYVASRWIRQNTSSNSLIITDPEYSLSVMYYGERDAVPLTLIDNLTIFRQVENRSVYLLKNDRWFYQTAYAKDRLNNLSRHLEVIHVFSPEIILFKIEHSEAAQARASISLERATSCSFFAKSSGTTSHSARAKRPVSGGTGAFSSLHSSL